MGKERLRSLGVSEHFLTVSGTSMALIGRPYCGTVGLLSDKGNGPSDLTVDVEGNNISMFYNLINWKMYIPI